MASDEYFGDIGAPTNQNGFDRKRSNAYVSGDNGTGLQRPSTTTWSTILFNEIRTALISYITKHPENGGCAMDLLMIAKYFERIGDHAVNVAEWVVFSLTGIHKWESNPD
jgi:hypothetical protein